RSELPSSATPHSFPFHAPPPTQTYTLSLHDALPICEEPGQAWVCQVVVLAVVGVATPLGEVAADGQIQRAVRLHPPLPVETEGVDRKSTRLNSSHVSISYAVFCLKKKTTTSTLPTQ